jgi:hypothetical protein
MKAWSLAESHALFHPENGETIEREEERTGFKG